MAESVAPSPPDALAKLRGIVDAFPAQGYAVLDGGLYDDLSALLCRARLFARSLFLDKADHEVQAAGPWLVRLDQAPEAIDKVFALVGDRPAAVFWNCGAGETVLWRHLRGLNMARIPSWAANGGREPPDDPVEAERTEAVMFRHWDPRVLGALLPCLDAAQFSRMLGPATEIAFSTEDHGGARRVVHDPAWPPAPAGLLTIRQEQIDALVSRQVLAMHRRNKQYLLEVAAPYLSGSSAGDLHNHINTSYETGKKLGVESEEGHALWSLLMLLSKGRIMQNGHVCQYISHGLRHPDIQIKNVVEQTMSSLHSRSTGKLQ